MRNEGSRRGVSASPFRVKKQHVAFITDQGLAQEKSNLSHSSTLKKRGFSFPCRQGARWPRPRHTAPFCGEGILGENLCSAFSLVKPILASIKQQT